MEQGLSLDLPCRVKATLCGPETVTGAVGSLLDSPNIRLPETRERFQNQVDGSPRAHGQNWDAPFAALGALELKGKNGTHHLPPWGT